MTAQRANHIPPPSRLQDSRLFAHHLERGPHAQILQVGRDAQRRIVSRWLDVVLGVEPEDDIDRAFRGEGAAAIRIARTSRSMLPRLPHRQRRQCSEMGLGLICKIMFCERKWFSCIEMHRFDH